MKRTAISIYIIVLAALTASGCGKKSEDMTPVPLGETTVFKDQVYKFSFKAPKAWVAESVPGATTGYYSSQGSEVRFQKFTEGDYGAKIEVGVREGVTKEQEIENFKKSIEGNITFKGPEPATLEGQPALKVSFTTGTADDAYMGYRIYGNKDSVVTYFEAATFGQKRMDKYKAVFDNAEKSATLGYVLKMTGKMDSATMAKLKEETKPSENFANYNGSGYSISYPDNFNIQATGKGVKFEGDWRGATISVDVFPSNGSDLGKFAQENASKNYGGAAVGGGSVGSESAKVINYSPVAGVSSRAYFVAKGGNVYRITINWPKELEGAFRPPFEKSANSFKFK